MALPPTRLTHLLYACRPIPADLLAQLARYGCLERTSDRAQVLALITQAVAIDPHEAPRVGPTLQDRVAQALLASPFLSEAGRRFATEPPFPPPRRRTRGATIALWVLGLAFLAGWFALYRSDKTGAFVARQGPVFLALAIYIALVLVRLKIVYRELPPQATSWAVLMTPYWYTALAGATAGFIAGLVAGEPGMGTLLGLVGAFIHRGCMAAWRRVGLA